MRPVPSGELSSTTRIELVTSGAPSAIAARTAAISEARFSASL